MLNVIMPVIIVAIVACALRGFCRFCIDFDNWNDRRVIKNRNAIPDSPIEKGIRAAIRLMVDNPENWVTIVKESESRKAHYPGAGERIKRVDGKVEFKYYGGRYPEVTLEGVGTFSDNQLKPEVINLIKETCGTFKQLVAVHMLLSPDKVVDGIPHISGE